MSDPLTQSVTSSGDLTVQHGHLFGCNGGCDIPIHECRSEPDEGLDVDRLAQALPNMQLIDHKHPDEVRRIAAAILRNLAAHDALRSARAALEGADR